MKYFTPAAGEWVQPVRRGYKMCCCDCGLTHRIDFRVWRGKAQFRVWPARRATAMARRWMKK
jgi:hypothetical protein